MRLPLAELSQVRGVTFILCSNVLFHRTPSTSVVFFKTYWENAPVMHLSAILSYFSLNTTHFFKVLKII